MRILLALIDSMHVPVGEEKEAEVRQDMQELIGVCGVLKEGLDPFRRHANLGCLPCSA